MSKMLPCCYNNMTVTRCYSNIFENVFCNTSFDLYLAFNMHKQTRIDFNPTGI